MANARERAAFSAGDDKVQIRKRITVKIMLKLTAYVSGKVQMAGYRSKVVTIARVFGLKGYVMNLSDSRVKIVAEGHEADLERFLEAIRIKNTLIDVEEIEAEFSGANGSYEEFFKVAGERETDARLDQAADYLKELISAVREGFRDNGSKLDSMGSKLDGMSSFLKEISGKQDQIIDRIDCAREEIVSEVSGMRSDLKGRTEERLQRIESDVTEIKARMRS
jgi:acylphosphatase